MLHTPVIHTPLCVQICDSAFGEDRAYLPAGMLLQMAIEQRKLAKQVKELKHQLAISELLRKEYEEEEHELHYLEQRSVAHTWSSV